MHPFINCVRGFGFEPQCSGDNSIAGKEGKATVISGALTPSCSSALVCSRIARAPHSQMVRPERDPCCPQKSNQGVKGSIAPFCAIALSWSTLLETRDPSSSPTGILDSRWIRGWDVPVWEYFYISSEISWNKELPRRQEPESGSLEEGERIMGLVPSCITKKSLLTFSCFTPWKLCRRIESCLSSPWYSCCSLKFI